MEHERAVIRIYSSEIDCIADETADHPDIETGGSLFGLWSDRGNPTIHLATRPGPNAERHVTLFEQDPDFHWRIEQLVLHHFGVQSVGLWHSHHRLGLPELSGGDLRRAREFARRSGRVKFTDVLSYFDEYHRPEQRREVSLKPHVYLDAPAGRQAPTRFEVIPGVSPIRAAFGRIVPREFRAALDRARRRPRASVRLETSLVQEARHHDDAAFAMRAEETPPPPPLPTATSTASEPERSEARVLERAERQPPAMDEPEAQIEPEAPQAEAEPEDAYGVADYDQFLRHLEALLAHVGMPAGISCSIEQVRVRGPVVLTMEAPGDVLVHDLDLAVHNGRLVAIRHRVRDARSRDAKELIVTEVRRAEDSVRAAIESFRKFGSI